MGEVKELARFYELIRLDPKIGTSHISLYIALFLLYDQNGFRNPVNICRKEVMEIAKIKGLATFHKCIRDLSESGYIQYFPSYNAAVFSQVNLIKV
jgi:hypothetical protein